MPVSHHMAYVRLFDRESYLILGNLRTYEIKLFSGLCFSEQKEIRWGEENPLLSKAEFY